MAKNEMFNATVIARENVTDELMIYKIRPDFAIPDFEAGQYVALGVCECDANDDDACHKGLCHYEPQEQRRKLVKRAYSIASPPNNKDHLEFFIGLVPAGAFTNRLARLGPGARLHVTPKMVGGFTLAGVPADKNLVLISTGTGIAPYVSMLRMENLWVTGRCITLLHGVRYASDLAYRFELEAYQHSRSGFRYIPLVSRQEAPEGVYAGRVQHIILSGTLELDPERDHVYLCGNPAMVEDVQALLETRGFTLHTKQTPGSIHVEKYW